MGYQAMKGHEGILNACYLVKETNLTKLHTVWFQWHDILQKAKLCQHYKDHWFPGVKEGGGMNR